MRRLLPYAVASAVAAPAGSLTITDGVPYDNERITRQIVCDRFTEHPDYLGHAAWEVMVIEPVYFADGRSTQRDQRYLFVGAEKDLRNADERFNQPDTIAFNDYPFLVVNDTPVILLSDADVEKK